MVVIEDDCCSRRVRFSFFFFLSPHDRIGVSFQSVEQQFPLSHICSRALCELMCLQNRHPVRPSGSHDRLIRRWKRYYFTTLEQKPNVQTTIYTASLLYLLRANAFPERERANERGFLNETQRFSSLGLLITPFRVFRKSVLCDLISDLPNN